MRLRNALWVPLLIALSAPFAVGDETEELPPFEVTHPGYAAYKRLGCNVCHGPDLAGTRMAPPLTDAFRYWTKATFARYLADPDSSLKADERLQRIDQRFRMFVMPPFRIPEEDLGALTDLVLRQP